jgi:hypothetical protein
VKYKRIGAALHNFGHSFMSGMNYVDGDHVLYEMHEATRDKPHSVTINFSSGHVDPPLAGSERIARAVAIYQEWLPKQLASQQVDPGALRDVLLIHRRGRAGYETVMSAVDDRGTKHTIDVRETE